MTIFKYIQYQIRPSKMEHCSCDQQFQQIFASMLELLRNTDVFNFDKTLRSCAQGRGAGRGILVGASPYLFPLYPIMRYVIESRARTQQSWTHLHQIHYMVDQKQWLPHHICDPHRQVWTEMRDVFVVKLLNTIFVKFV